MSAQGYESDEASEADHSDLSADELDPDLEDLVDDLLAENTASTKIPAWQSPPLALFHVASDGAQGGDTNWQVYRDLPIIRAAADNEGGGPQIRLMKILPGTGDQPIRCALVRRPLYDTPDYQALSYSWGEDRRHTEKIFVESSNVEILIAFHLWKAIQRLRDDARAVFVWIDAICIDQHNVLERAAQVGIMAQIYDQARQVVIWLGGATLPEGKHSNTHGDAKMFLALCEQTSPWWSRLWILQECAYASQCPVVLFGGDSSMALSEFIDRWQDSMSYLLRHDQYDAYLVMKKNFDLMHTPYSIWISQKERNEHRRPLLNRLRETRDRHCTNRYDRVFALRSLVLEHEEEQLGSDYRESITTLFPRLLDILRTDPDWREQQDEDLLYALHPLSKSLFDPQSSGSDRYEALRELSLQGDHAAARAFLEILPRLPSMPWPADVLRAAVMHNWSDIAEQLSQPTATYGDPCAAYLLMLRNAAREDRQKDLLGLLDLSHVFTFDDVMLSTILSTARNGSVHYLELLEFAGILYKGSGASSQESYVDALRYAFQNPELDQVLPSIMPRVIQIIRSSVKGSCGMFPYVIQAARLKQARFLKLLLEKGPIPSRSCYQLVILQELLSMDEDCLEILLAASKGHQAAYRCLEHPGRFEGGLSIVVDVRDDRLITAVSDLISSADPSRDGLIHLLVREAPDLAIDERILCSAAAAGRFDLLMYLQNSQHLDRSPARDAHGVPGASPASALDHDIGPEQLSKILAKGTILQEALNGAAAQGRTEDVKFLLQVCAQICSDVECLGDAFVAACESNRGAIVQLLLSYDALEAWSKYMTDSQLLHQAFRAACWHGCGQAAEILLQRADLSHKLRDSLPVDVVVEVFRKGHDVVAELLLENRAFRPEEHGEMLVQACAAACWMSSEAHDRVVGHLVRYALTPILRHIALEQAQKTSGNAAETGSGAYPGYFKDHQLLLREHPLDCLLFATCTGNHPDLATALLDIATRPFNGPGLYKCALIVLSYRGQTELVRRFVEGFGIDVLGLDRASNAASVARQRGHSDVAQLLSEHGANNGYLIEEYQMAHLKSCCDVQGGVGAEDDYIELSSPQVWEEVEDRLSRERSLVQDLLALSCYAYVSGLDRLLGQYEMFKGAALTEEDLRSAFAAAALARHDSVRVQLHNWRTKSDVVGPAMDAQMKIMRQNALMMMASVEGDSA